jgi:hypothetical protein
MNKGKNIKNTFNVCGNVNLSEVIDSTLNDSSVNNTQKDNDELIVLIRQLIQHLQGSDIERKEELISILKDVQATKDEKKLRDVIPKVLQVGANIAQIGMTIASILPLLS